MSLTPETFQRELTHRLGRDHRLRWSPSQSAWCIEQKIGRGVWDLPLTSSGWDDKAIRARDGYALICTVQPRPFVICSNCFFPIDIPHLTIGEAKCPACVAMGRPVVSRFEGYFPLCERLLQRLERLSIRNSANWRREMDEKNRRLAADRQRAYDNETEDILRDHFNRIVDIPQVGAGGIIASKGL